MKKKFLSTLLAVVAVFGISTSVFAADGITRTSGWDEVGYQSGITFPSYANKYGSIFESTGGGILVDIGTNYVSGPDNQIKIELWEDDGTGTTSDDKVANLGYVNFTGDVYEFTLSGIDTWKDGTNNRAELYIKYVLVGEDSLNVVGSGRVTEMDFD